MQNDDFVMFSRRLYPTVHINAVLTVIDINTYQSDPIFDLFVSGFGKTGDEAPQAVILQQARLPVVTNSECSILNKYPTVTSNMLCAGYGLDFSHTESGCRGDSGGPFVCEKNGAWFVQGVVSWGSSRCISGENFTVFARVLNFVAWIKATIG